VADVVAYAKPFFDLQLQFASRVITLSGLPLSRTLLDYTNFYIRFGLGHGFDPAHPVWQEYLAGLEHTDARREWTYRFYLRSLAATPPSLVGTCGCFSYSKLSNTHIRLHFQNAEPSGASPLALDRRRHRLADLTQLFGHIKRIESGPLKVIGASWLYNLDAYCRLFPALYIKTARVMHRRFRHMPLWGQFLNRRREVKQDMASEFLRRLESQSNVEQLDQCFPLQVLRVEASVSAFYDFYDVSP